MVASSQELMVGFAASMIVFQGTFEVSKSVLQKLISKKGFTFDEKNIPKLTSHGPSYIVQYLFAFTFFVTRVVIYFIGVVELFGQRSVLKEVVANKRVPGFVMGTTLLFVGAGSILNLLWFQKILAMAFSKGKKKEKHS
eukprot:scaffold880_cov132-Cylindrotheca_fusiformis.AAC.71